MGEESINDIRRSMTQNSRAIYNVIEKLYLDMWSCVDEHTFMRTMRTRKQDIEKLKEILCPGHSGDDDDINQAGL